jgi:hypothetical protein
VGSVPPPSSSGGGVGGGLGGILPGGAGGAGGGPGGVYAPYYFNIGSVESFERKLEQVQRDMGLPPRDFIPVQYVNETNWAVELVSCVININAVILYSMQPIIPPPSNDTHPHPPNPTPNTRCASCRRRC